MTPGRVLRVGAMAAAVGLTAVGLAEAQVLRVEDEDGVVHYTNNPCDPRYVRLAPQACRPEPSPGGDAVAAAGLGPAIETTAARYGVDRRLVEAVVQVESGGNPRAVSPKGAQGLMQLMPSRSAALGVGDAFDPRANLDGGVRHLRDLLLRYAGNVPLALAAYNAGEDAVHAHGGVPPYRETQEYVRKILALFAPVGTPPAVKRAPTRSRL